MNGGQDLGGTMGFGPVRPEPDEPVFHEPWEARVLALTVAMGASGRWNLDMSRFAREDVSPAHYLARSYYQMWFEGLCRLLLQAGVVTGDELSSGRSLGAGAPLRVLAAADVATAMSRGTPTQRPAQAAPRWAVGDAVRTREMNPATHTRLPRYARGKRGAVIAWHGAHVYPDTHAHGAGECPQHLYTVRFDAVELWGPDTTAASVCVDCWEPYLEAR